MTTYTYGSQGLLTEITDPLSHDTTFSYDNHGRRTTVTNHEGKTVTTGYDNYDRVTSVTAPDPDGEGSQTTSVTAYAYDRRNLVTSITDPRDGVTAFTYDALGQLTNLRDASNNDTAWTYDGLGRVTAETNELNKTRSYGYDAAGNLLRQTDRNGRTTRFTYDNLDRLTEEKWISGGTVPTATNVTTTQGGPHDEVQRVGHQNAFTGTFTLTFDGQTTAAIAFDANAATVRTALENLSNIDDGDLTVTKTQNSTGNHEWQIVFRGSKSGVNVAQITINTAGLMPSPSATQTTDTQGSASNTEVQVVTINNATGGTFRLTFESTAYGQEQTGDLAHNASAATVETALDGLAGIDNVTVTGNAGGPYTITFGGTQSNTNVAQISADVTFLTSGSVDRTISYAYDAASQLTSTSDTDSSYAYTYDNLGRVLTASNSGTSGVPTVVLTSAYNANSQRTSLSSTRGGTNDFLNSYTYDNLNRLTRLDQTGNGGATVANKRVDLTYNALGQFATIARQVKPSSTWDEVATSTFTYDTLNRLTALDHKKGSTDIANYDWTYDAMNRVTQFSGPDGTSDYTYDKESQLTATDHSFQTDESYTYDSTGNRTSGSYSVGTNNRMTSDGTYNYTYDDDGNRLTRMKISDNSLIEYSWDHRNRLTKVVERATGSGGAITKQTDYKYDVFDRRISKSVDADGAGAGAAVVSRFVYFGDNIALQFDGSNNLTHRYLHGPAVDQILAAENASNSILWSLADNLGTVRDLVNDSGTVQNHLKYDSFGKVTAESNAAVDHLFAFTGRERDEDTGLQFHRARYYDPATGRWISEDPIGFSAGDPNLSRMVSNSTPNAVDSTGLEGNNPSWSYQFSVLVPRFDYAAWKRYDMFVQEQFRAGATPQAQEASGGTIGWIEYELNTQWAMLSNQGAYWEGFLEGKQHGSMMLDNAATLHQIEWLNNNVNQLIAEHGGCYGTANGWAHVGVASLYAAGAAWGWSALGLPTWGGYVGAGQGVTGTHWWFSVTAGGQTTMYSTVLGEVMAVPTGYFTPWLSVTGVPIFFPAAAAAISAPWCNSCFCTLVQSYWAGIIGRGLLGITSISSYDLRMTAPDGNASP